MAKKDNAEAKAEDAKKDNPIFYQNPVFLDQKKHEKKSLNDKLGFSFAKEQVAVPVNAVEFPFLSRHYPVVFVGADTTTPAAFMGMRPNENLFISKEGEWAERTYVPAYVRRYPFIMSEDKENDKLILCVDETDKTIKEAKENKFFDGEEMTDLTKNALEFCKSYHQASLQTVEYGKKLRELDILSPFQHQILLNMGFNALFTIDERKFNALPDDKILELRKMGALPIIYAQLFSMNNWQTLFDKVAALNAAENKDSDDKSKKKK